MPVVFNFHGFTAAIKQLCWERPNSERFDINGFREEGSTTTPFDMQIRNKTSRFHIVIQSAQKIARRNPSVAALAEDLLRNYESKIAAHRTTSPNTESTPPRSPTGSGETSSSPLSPRGEGRGEGATQAGCSN